MGPTGGRARDGGRGFRLRVVRRRGGFVGGEVARRRRGVGTLALSLGSLIKSNLNLSKIFNSYSTRKVGNYLNNFDAKKRGKIIREYYKN